MADMDDSTKAQWPEASLGLLATIEATINLTKTMTPDTQQQIGAELHAVLRRYAKSEASDRLMQRIRTELIDRWKEPTL